MAERGVDLSSYNGSVDWGKVDRAGIDFAYLKVNEGDLMDRSTSEARVKTAKSQGIKVGGYNFLRPRKGRSGAQEFELFYARAKAVGLMDAGSLLPVADVEATALSPSATRSYVKSWVNRCVKRTGHHPVIYTGKWFWDGSSYRGSNSVGCKLWLSVYGPAWSGYVPSGWKTPTVWQYSDKGHVDGIGSCDVDRIVSGGLSGIILGGAAAPSWLTKKEWEMVNVLTAQRRIAVRNGGWHKVSPTHLAKAVVAKSWLRGRLVLIAVGSGSNRPKRRTYIKKIVKG